MLTIGRSITTSALDKGVSAPAKSSASATANDGIAGRLVSFPKRHKILAISILSLLVIAGVGGWAKSRSHSAPVKVVEPVATVTTQAAAFRQMPADLLVTGTISATDPLTIGAASNGLSIESVDVEEGDYVKKGQVLARLDSSVLSAQIAAMHAQMAGANASLAKAIQPNRPEDINSMEAAYHQALADVQQKDAMAQQAKASAKLAADTSQRYAYLLREGAISKQEAESHSTDAVTAQASLQAAEEVLRSAKFAAAQVKNKLSMAQEGGRREDVQISRSTANEVAANIQQLNAQMALTIVRAPDDGIITKRYAHIGDISSSSKPLFEMIRKGQIELRAQVTQSDIARLKPGQVAELSDGNRTATGTLFQISPVVDATTRLGTVRIEIPSGSKFLPGMFVRGKLALGQRDAMVVPNSAVQSDEDRYYVFVYDDGTAKRRLVSVGTRNQELAEITDGLSKGEQVIVAGAGFLNDNDPVRVSN